MNQPTKILVVAVLGACVVGCASQRGKVRDSGVQALGALAVAAREVKAAAVAIERTTTAGGDVNEADDWIARGLVAGLVALLIVDRIYDGWRRRRTCLRAPHTQDGKVA